METLITNEVLATKIDHLTELVETHINRDDERFGMLFNVINGDNGNPGMKVRLDRIEQLENSRRWNLRTIWAAIVAIIVGWAFKLTVSG